MAISPNGGPKSALSFVGRWRIAREIAHADGLTGAFEGLAVVAASGPDRFSYDEDGTLTLGRAEPMRATRRYIWHASGQGINVYFAGGAPFHRVDLSGPRTATVHLCAPDRYAVSYDFSDWPVWTARWQVEGPRKAYEMTSSYYKAP